MPELPEVETIARELSAALPGRRIRRVETTTSRVIRSPLQAAEGQSITAIRRHGKFLIIDCDSGALAVHLGMTGKLLVDAPRTPYTRAVFTFDDGGTLLYDDIRQFGRLEWESRRLDALGPDPLAIALAEFIERLRARRGRIKPLLLDQRFLRGLGNIYTDEALFRARIHPRAVAARLSRPRAAALHGAIREVLEEAIAHRGSSISDYVDASGQRGGFQLLHRVYGKEGQPCVVCGAPIRRIVIAQRGTHFCARCQK